MELLVSHRRYDRNPGNILLKVPVDLVQDGGIRPELRDVWLQEKAEAHFSDRVIQQVGNFRTMMGSAKKNHSAG